MSKLVSKSNAYIQRALSVIRNGDSRTGLMVQNIFGSLLMRGVSVGISFLLVPLTIDYIDKERYGIWLVIFNMIVWFSLLDIGFGNGLRNKFSEAAAEDDLPLQRKLIHTTITALLGISGILFMLNILFVRDLHWDSFFGVSISYRAELQQLIFILINLFCVQFVFQIYNPIQYALQRPAMINFAILAGNVLALAGVLYLREYSTPSLLNLGVVVMGSNLAGIVFFALYFFIFQRPDLLRKFRFPSFLYVKDIFSLGIKFFFLNIAYMVQFQTSNILISRYFSSEDVTEFNIAFKLFSVATLIFGIIISPVWSSVTNAQVKGDYQWIRKLIKRLFYIWLGIFACCTLGLILAPFIYGFWVPTVDVPFLTTLGVVLIVLSNCFSDIFIHVLNGLGKVNLQFYLSIFVILFFIPIAYYLSVSLSMGVFGICIAIVVTNINGLLVAPVQLWREMRLKRA
ncbi:MAG: MATE family efflux transporter [Leeuwenhoekiella sp.]